MAISLKNKIGLEIFRQLVYVETQLHELRYLFWECTLRCNLKCIHCGSDCKKDSRQKDMPMSDFLKVLKEIKNHISPSKIKVVITGGEPLLRQDLEMCGQEIGKLGYRWGLVTNAVALTKDRLLSLMHSQMQSITVSLDGFAHAHNWLRGDNSFTPTLNAIKQITQQPTLTHDVVTCITEKNIGELEEFKNFLIETGVKRWRLSNIFPTGRAENNKELNISSEHYKYLMDFIVLTRKENKIKTTYSCEGFLSEYEKQVRDDFYICRAGINIASVLADGSISACPNINHSFVQGNIYKEDFLTVWDNKFQLMRNRQWTKKDSCLECRFYKYCKGNGVHLYKNTEDKLSKCHYNLLKT